MFPLRNHYRAVRGWTESLCAPLETEDYVVRSMNDVSPAKWHLAHTSWFFETFVLGPHLAGYQPLDSRYAYLFNSYYVQAGERHCRAQRGLATRPTVDEVYAYRAHVDAAMERLFDQIEARDSVAASAAELIQLGLQHEQQHQELILTDIKHVLWMNPLRPTYHEADTTGHDVTRRSPVDGSDTRTSAHNFAHALSQGDRQWCDITEGVYEIGYVGDDFAFDNEGPRHRTYLQSARVATRLVTNREYLAFIDDGGYRRPELWLSSGWDTVQSERWEAPLYWERESTNAPWHAFTLRGTQVIDDTVLEAPVCHISFFEADAYARWAGGRLPTEAEWEVVAASASLDATPDAYSEGERYHPMADQSADHSTNDRGGPLPSQLFGTVWQWTSSPYIGYPGYRPVAGAIGEYNGKWMCDQWVLRGASCATPRSHARHTYRNFFPASTRWQFAGIRLATDA